MSSVVKRLAGAVLFLLALALGCGIVAAAGWYMSGGLSLVLGVFGVVASRAVAAWILFYACAAMASQRVLR